jgi:hypothetical protein
MLFQLLIPHTAFLLSYLLLAIGMATGVYFLVPLLVTLVFWVSNAVPRPPPPTLSPD